MKIAADIYLRLEIEISQRKIGTPEIFGPIASVK